MTHNLMDLQVGGVSRARISSTGALALGNVVSPLARLHILGVGNTASTYQINCTNSDGTLSFRILDNNNVYAPKLFLDSFGGYSNAYINTSAALVFGSGANASSAILQINSTSQGFLPPRMTTAQKTTLGNTAVAGLVVYDTDLKKLCLYTAATTGQAWETVASS
jgi:hypothetical protein